MTLSKCVPDDLKSRLQLHGLDRIDAELNAGRFAAAGRALSEAGADLERGVVARFAPGRVEVLGKHTDYAGGSSLVGAVQRGICLVALPRADTRISIHAVDIGRSDSFEIADADSMDAPGWTVYPRSVVRRLRNNFGLRRGADIAMAGTLPHASGMSSSSAVVVGLAAILIQINEIDQTDLWRRHIRSTEDLAGYLATIENGQSFGKLEGARGVGTFGGSEDHLAILGGGAGNLLLCSFAPAAIHQSIRLPAEYTFAYAVSGVVAEKTGAARDRYNRASRLVSAIVEDWNKVSSQSAKSLKQALDRAGADGLKKAVQNRVESEFAAGDRLRRLEHFIRENEDIIPAAVQALQRADVEEFGRQVHRSQEATESLLQNQVPQTIHLAKSARDCGALAASAFGAGFGGAVYALIRRDDADEFLSEWAGRAEASDVFSPEERRRMAFFHGRPGPATFDLS